MAELWILAKQSTPEFMLKATPPSYIPCDHNKSFQFTQFNFLLNYKKFYNLAEF